VRSGRWKLLQAVSISTFRCARDAVNATIDRGTPDLVPHAEARSTIGKRRVDAPVNPAMSPPPNMRLKRRAHYRVGRKLRCLAGDFVLRLHRLRPQLKRDPLRRRAVDIRHPKRDGDSSIALLARCLKLA